MSRAKYVHFLQTSMRLNQYFSLNPSFNVNIPGIAATVIKSNNFLIRITKI
jgi:hypothetical protein